MKNWEEELKHYQKNPIDDVKDEDLLDEAIASCENIFSLMEEDELHHHSRPLVMAYLALKHMKRQTETTFTKEQIDYTHDILTDLLTSCMFSGSIPVEKPEIGDWVIESSRFNKEVDRDCCIGKLIKANDETGEYTIVTVGGKEVTWNNSIVRKIPDKYLRIK